MFLGWTVENVETLKQHVDLGWSASQSGRHFGVTRNCALGKASRLGWHFHSGGGGENHTKHRLAEVKRIRQAKPPKLPKPPNGVIVRLPTAPRRIEVEGAQRVLLVDLRSGQCKWPLEDQHLPPGEMAEQLFCGLPGTPYCPCHKAAAWQPATGGRSDKRMRDTFRRFG